MGTAYEAGRASTIPVEADVALPPVAGSAGAARRFIAATLTSWDLEDLVDTATLLVSELVTNAILHARSDVTVTVRRDTEQLRVAVSDTGEGLPQVRRATDTATTGRGLALVDACALAWGVDPGSAGKSVWFVLAA